MKGYGAFRQYWQTTGAQINTIVSRRQGARAFIPDMKIEKEGNNYRLGFTAPLFLYNAPQKGSSTALGPSHRLGIFVDGDYLVSDSNGQTQMLQASANLSIYNTTHVANTSFSLKLFDAMHFDMEPDPQGEFHPIFHVQRGASKTIDHKKIIEGIVRATRLPENSIFIDDDTALGTGYLRIPTPQMDYLSVTTTVVADFFCSGGQATSETKTMFKTLVRSILGNRNIMRDGRASQTLRNRWTAQFPFGSGHWYKESC